MTKQVAHCQLFKPSIIDSVRGKYTSAHSLFSDSFFLYLMGARFSFLHL